MNTNMTGFRCFSNILRPCALDESRLSIERVKLTSDECFPSPSITFQNMLLSKNYHMSTTHYCSQAIFGIPGATGMNRLKGNNQYS